VTAKRDWVFVTGLTLHAYHGVKEHEASDGQTFLIDLELEVDLAEASISDKLATTVDYEQVVEHARMIFCGQRFRLVEAAAGAIARGILDHFARVAAIRVTVHKPSAPIDATFADVGVSILRNRHG
jgi:dihydroneopterin aldolase